MSVLDETVEQAAILIIDDEEANVTLLRRILEPRGFENLTVAADGREGLELFDRSRPDLVLLDLLMPGMDGFEFLEALQERIADEEYLPVLVLTSDHSHDAKRRALSGGAADFLTKPLSPAEVRLRVFNLLQTRFLQKKLRYQNELLEDQKLLLEHRVRARTRDLEAARLEILTRLARAAEYRDDVTGEHTRRVGRTSAALGRELGLDDETIQMLRLGAPLHDVGKIGVPDEVLLSPRALTEEEFEVMKAHTTIGADLLGNSGFPLLDHAAEIALTHHERWDGKGYPRGLAGSHIPVSGRIVSVADTFDALTHARPYKEAWTMERAIEEILDSGERRFDPDVVEAFRAVVDSLSDDETAA